VFASEEWRGKPRLAATVRLFSASFFRKVITRHDTGMGESYMDGDWEVRRAQGSNCDRAAAVHFAREMPADAQSMKGRESAEQPMLSHGSTVRLHARLFLTSPECK